VRESDAYLSTGLDYSTDTFSPEEKAAVLSRYREMHDYRDLDLAPFARFGVEHNPVGFKALKRHVEALGRTALPVGPMVLMWSIRTPCSATARVRCTRSSPRVSSARRARR